MFEEQAGVDWALSMLNLNFHVPVNTLLYIPVQPNRHACENKS